MRLLVIAIALCACRGTVPPAADAALRVALAEGAVRHAADAGCYTGCATGWTCDHFTGFCCNPAESSCHSTDPCEGRCAAYERCVVELGLPHCESIPPDAGIALSRYGSISNVPGVVNLHNGRGHVGD